MSESAANRRQFLRDAAYASLAGALPTAAAQHVHEHAAQSKAASPAGVYKPRLLTAAEFKTVTLLADIIIPPEDGQPGGSAAGAPAYIDLLCSAAVPLAESWRGGLAWLDAESRRTHGAAFSALPASSRTALLDRIAYRRNASPELNPGIRFFALARQMVVDAWVTSPEGTRLLGYKGNVGMQKFDVPVEALNYALARSPFKQG